MIQELIAILAEKRDLTREQAAHAMRVLMSGEVSAALMSAFLIGLRMKGETIEEITGFAETMRQLATPVHTSRRPLVDTCSTGGDRSDSFNISTTAAFVAAGADLAVAKHGNRGATRKCGSADVLEALGVNIDASAEVVGNSLDSIGIGFLFARKLHAAMKYVAPVRQELRLRTVFNILGPLTNPAPVTGQVVGVFDARLTEPLARVLANLGIARAMVVSGSDGLSELTLGGPTRVAEASKGQVRVSEITPEHVRLPRAAKEALRGGDATSNARMLRAVLEGESGPRRDVVLLNAAAALLVGERASDWKEGVEMARRSIDSGAARDKLDALVKRSHDS
ncbi:MAG: anthranilate phosphoribosyltransferase [Candidatus Hydrogenedentes bacterium]|nr:anthranilate phosphoribosyltransferase [Candidatus Hydrogenedentota bacterium]